MVKGKAMDEVSTVKDVKDEQIKRLVIDLTQLKQQNKQLKSDLKQSVELSKVQKVSKEIPHLKKGKRNELFKRNEQFIEKVLSIKDQLNINMEVIDYHMERELDDIKGELNLLPTPTPPRDS